MGYDACSARCLATPAPVDRAVNILLSAYACEPGTGSEPGLGWNWAIELARAGHDVCVLTRASLHKPAIDAYRARHDLPPGLRFVHYELSWWKRGGVRSRIVRRVHCYLWQWGAYREAKRLLGRRRFDVVHHVTWAGIRFPSFMGGLGIPFVFGPVGGGERAPWRLRRGFGLRGQFLDALRDLSNLWVRVDPLMRRTLRQADRVLVRSAQTLALVPRRLRDKASVRVGIGSDMVGRETDAPPVGDGGRILYVGQFRYLKGMHLGLEAFARVVARVPEARLTLVGSGAERRRWHRLATRLGVSESVDWIPWVAQDELPALYRAHDLFLFPSLHDSGGMVVVEAMAHGLPVVCLRLGGPGVIVDERCGFAIETGSAARGDVVDRMAAALLGIVSDRDRRERLARGALARAGEYTWKAQVAGVYDGLLAD